MRAMLMTRQPLPLKTLLEGDLCTVRFHRTHFLKAVGCMRLWQL